MQAHAAEAAVHEANAAAASGAKAAAFRLDVGLDAKALAEAWAACQKAHPELPVMFLSADTSECCTLDNPSSLDAAPAGLRHRQCL